MSPSPNRGVLVLAIALVALVFVGGASAHGRARVIALDVTVDLDQVPAGIHAEVIDGDRLLELRADPATRVVVLGALGEAMLRFDRNGVSANRTSPTASSDRIVRPGSGWTLLTDAHSWRWHDHRLAQRPRMTVYLEVNGRRDALTGTFTRVPRPRLWPWLLGAALFAAAAARLRTPFVPAFVAAFGSLAAAASFHAWVETLMAAALVAALGAARRRPLLAGVVGAVAVATALGWLGVFRHGVVVSALPFWLARLATGAAFVGGLVAVVLGVLQSRTEQVSDVRRDERPDL